MKPDYILGLGDSGEYAIVGGRWNPKTNNFLKISTSFSNLAYRAGLFNEFFLAVIMNAEDVKRLGVTPILHVIATMEAGFTQLELLSFCRDLESDVLPANTDQMNVIEL